MLTSLLDIWTPDLGGQYALVQDLAAMADSIEEGVLNPPYIRLTNTWDASLTSTQHALQIGPTNDLNIIMDSNEMMARNNGGASQFNLNVDGGDIAMGNTDSVISARGGFLEGWNYLGTQNLNSVRVGGRYIQTGNVNATSGRNYPAERAGFLEVVTNSWSGSTGFILQRYSDYQMRMVWQRAWYNGTWTSWTPAVPISGVQAVSGISQNNTRTVTTTFPAGAFSSAPAVVITPHTAVPQNVFVGTSSISASGFTTNIRRTDTTDNLNFSWVAL